MTSDNQTATKGATFVDVSDPTLSVDVIQEDTENKKKKYVPPILVDIDGLRVLNIKSLKSEYNRIVSDNFDVKQMVAPKKVNRLNDLSDDTETNHPSAAEDNNAGDIQRNNNFKNVTRTLFN